MPAQETVYKIFIASPSGLNAERKAFADVIDEYNKSDAMPRSVSFRAVGWEDTLAGMGRPQEIINEELKECDFFMLLLHNRWGSNPGENAQNATSGTEEEFKLAMQCYEDEKSHMKQIVCAFKSIDPQQLADPGKQLEKVIEFKKELEQGKKLLYSQFYSLEEFEKIIRNQLGRWLLNHENEAKRNEKIKVDLPIVPEETIHVEREDIEEFISNKYTEEIVNNAWELAKKGKLIDAEIEFSKALIYSPSDYKWLNYAKFLINIGQLDKSLMMLNKILEDEKTTLKNKATAYSFKGKILRTHGDLNRAKKMHKKSLEINESLSLEKEMTFNYSDLGDILKICGNLDLAENMFLKGLKISEDINFIEGIASQYGNLGNIFAKRGDLIQAELKYRKALNIYKELDNQKNIGIQLARLAIIKKDQKDFDSAKEMYQKALSVFKKLGYLKGTANTYGNLGNMLRDYGDIEESKAMCEKALEINKELGHLEGMAANYGNIGMVLIIQKDYESAEFMCRKALDINLQLGRLEGVAKQYGNLGNIKKAQGDFDSANQMYQKCFEIAKKYGFGRVAKHVNNSLEDLREEMKNKNS